MPQGIYGKMLVPRRKRLMQKKKTKTITINRTKRVTPASRNAGRRNFVFCIEKKEEVGCLLIFLSIFAGK